MTALRLPSKPAVLDQIARKPISDVKREGWRGIMRRVDEAGTLLMTNHDRPEAVILSLRQYRQLTELASTGLRNQASRLQDLTRAFDDEMAALAAPDAGERLRQAFDSPLVLGGQVVAGSGFDQPV